MYLQYTPSSERNLYSKIQFILIMGEKKICAVTMVRNDDFYLRKWVEYYGRELGRENLYILFDGTDQSVPDFCLGANTRMLERKQGSVVEGDRRRIGLLNGLAAELLERYDIVIGTDADEYIVADPAVSSSLADYLSSAESGPCLSPLGIDLGQKMGEEGDIDPDRPFLSQRRYGLIGTRYTKASIISGPVRWGMGFHRVKGHNFHIGKGLYLFHCGYFDMKRIQDRFSDKDRLADGWERHMKKRSRTIRVVTEKPARDFDLWTARARRIQTLVRPPYAWNKPAMFNLDIVVRIPDRFKNIV